MPSLKLLNPEWIEPTHLLLDTFNDDPKEITLLHEDDEFIVWKTTDEIGATMKRFIRWVEEL